MIYNGDIKIAGIKQGANEISAIYQGSTKMWPVKELTAVTIQSVYIGELLPYEGGTADWTKYTYWVKAYYSDGSSHDVQNYATYSSSTFTVGERTEYASAVVGSINITATFLGMTSAPYNVSVVQEGLPALEIWNYNMNNSYTVKFTKANKIQYSKNSGFTWTTLNSTSYTVTITARQSVLFRGCSGTTTLGGGRFIISGPEQDIWLKGNIMGLLGPNYTEQPVAASAFTNTFSGCSALWTMDKTLFRHMTTTAPYSCYHMFYGCNKLGTAPNLPATTLADYCYQGMFAYSYVTDIGDIGATTLGDYCCLNMFDNCTNLYDVSNHKLFSGATMGRNCCANMFFGCSNMVKAPYLLATTLGYRSYYQMFYGCTNLNEVHCDAIDRTAGSTTDFWFDYVQNTAGDFYGKAAANWPRNISGILSNWTAHLE